MEKAPHQPFDQLSPTRATFIVLDFETVTPRGRPPEPIELAAMRLLPGLQIDGTFEANWLIKPPDDLPVTAFDTRQTGIRQEDLDGQPSVDAVLRQFDAVIGNQPALFVAHYAPYDYGIIQRFKQCCPFVAAQLFLDTIALAKALIPGLPNYRLDTLAHHASLPIPQQRHRALPDVKLTVDLLLHLLQHLACPNTVADLKRLAGVGHRTEPSAKDAGASQLSLFL